MGPHKGPFLFQKTLFVFVFDHDVELHLKLFDLLRGAPGASPKPCEVISKSGAGVINPKQRVESFVLEFTVPRDRRAASRM
ncbi:MAG: hypothetical protein ACLGG7_12965, partial [Bacteriovoracia bacterium]